MTERSGLESDPIIPYADPADLPDALRSAIESYARRMGFLPNALKLYMHRPQILKCLIELNNTVMRDASGHLDDGLKRRVAAVCSALNHSPYCVAHNANTLKGDPDGEGEGWGWSGEDVRALLDPGFEPEDPVEGACFAFARAATRDPSDVPQAVIARLTEALTPPQVIELACVVGFWRMYNSIHESLYVPIEDELLGGRDFNTDELLGEAGRAPPPARAPPPPGWRSTPGPAAPSAPGQAGAGRERRGVHRVLRRWGRRALAAMLERSNGRRTVPQIFIDGDHIGGMDGMQALARAGELDTRLGIGIA